MEKWIDEAFSRACAKFKRGAGMAAQQGIIPYKSEGGKYVPSPFDGNSWWTGGFWPGIMWQLYKATGEEVYKAEALRTEELLTRELMTFDLLNHDVGFMYLLSCGAHYRLTGDAKARTNTLHAATLLAGRFLVFKGERWYTKDNPFWGNPAKKRGRFHELLLYHRPAGGPPPRQRPEPAKDPH